MMNPSQRYLLLLGSMAALVILGACQETAPTAPPAGPVSADVHITDAYYGFETGTCDRALHLQLEDWYEIPGVALWHPYSAVLDCESGDEFTIEPPGWGDGRSITLIVPAGAVPPTFPGYPMIEFTVSVPMPSGAIPIGGGEAPEPWTAIPILFSPDMVFNEAVTVVMSWPEFAAEPEGNGFDLAYITTEVHENTTHYCLEKIQNSYYSDAGGAAQPPVTGPWTDGIGFQVDHFTRWTLVNGDDPPGGPGVLDYLGRAEMECCWTDRPPDPLELKDPLPLLR